MRVVTEQWWQPRPLVPLELGLVGARLWPVLRVQCCAWTPQGPGVPGSRRGAVERSEAWRPAASLHAHGPSAGRQAWGGAGGTGRCSATSPLGVLASLGAALPSGRSRCGLHAAPGGGRPCARPWAPWPSIASSWPPCFPPSAPPTPGPEARHRGLFLKDACHATGRQTEGWVSPSVTVVCAEAPVAQGTPQPRVFFRSLCVGCASVSSRGTWRVSGCTSELSVNHLTLEGWLPPPPPPLSHEGARVLARAPQLRPTRKPTPFREPPGPSVFPRGPLVSARPLQHSGGCRPGPPDPRQRPASQPPPPQPSAGSLHAHTRVWAREGVEAGGVKRVPAAAGPPDALAGASPGSSAGSSGKPPTSGVCGTGQEAPPLRVPPLVPCSPDAVLPVHGFAPSHRAAALPWPHTGRRQATCARGPRRRAFIERRPDPAICPPSRVSAPPQPGRRLLSREQERNGASSPEPLARRSSTAPAPAPLETTAACLWRETPPGRPWPRAPRQEAETSWEP